MLRRLTNCRIIIIIINDRQTIVQQNSVETLHQHRATLKQELVSLASHET